jgi:hypothetical protein
MEMDPGSRAGMTTGSALDSGCRAGMGILLKKGSYFGLKWKYQAK